MFILRENQSQPLKWITSFSVMVFFPSENISLAFSVSPTQLSKLMPILKDVLISWASIVNAHGSPHIKEASTVPTEGPVLSLQGKWCRCTEIRYTKWSWLQAIWKRS